MLTIKKKYILYLTCVTIVLTLLIYAFIPEAVRVDIATAEFGKLTVTIEAEGKTRLRETFTISSPVSGRLNRIPFKEGSAVNERMLIARIDPLPIDPRQREELKARVNAAQEAYQEAHAKAELVRANLAQAERERTRAQELTNAGLLSRQALEQSNNSVTTLLQELDAAQHRLQAAAYEISLAKAGLIAYEPIETTAAKTVNIYAPVKGTLLHIFEKSERVVSAGTPLFEIGDDNKLELVIELLSTDAVKVHPDDRIIVSDWGGEKTLSAKVRLIEPAAFTKISALGIEEQRVNLIADLVEAPSSLGAGYKFTASIILMEKEHSLKLPLSAIFRNGDSWNIFLIKDGKATLQQVLIGERAATEVEVLGGIKAGDRVIIFPTNQIKQGVRVVSNNQ